MNIALLVGLGLTVSNFAWQAFTGKNWPIAFERSWFQWTACGLVAAIQYFAGCSMGNPR